MNTCDECKFFSLMSGLCRKHDVYRHSCGADACDDFELADDLKQMSDYENTGSEFGCE